MVFFSNIVLAGAAAVSGCALIWGLANLLACRLLKQHSRIFSHSRTLVTVQYTATYSTAYSWLLYIVHVDQCESPDESPDGE